MQEAAEHEGVSISAMRSRVQRGRRLLRELSRRAARSPSTREAT